MLSGLQWAIAEWKKAEEEGKPLAYWQQRTIEDEEKWQAMKAAEKASVPGQIKETIHEIKAGIDRLTALLERL